MLQADGNFLSISFTQPHFRLPAICRAECAWYISVQAFGSSESLGYFLYVMDRSLPPNKADGALDYEPAQFDVQPLHDHMDDEEGFLQAIDV